MKKSRKLSDRSPALRYLTHNRNRLLLWCGIILVVCVAFDFTPLGGKNLLVYKKWLECGQRPYQGVFSPEKPAYEQSPVFSPISFGYSSYYCSLDDVENIN